MTGFVPPFRNLFSSRAGTISTAVFAWSRKPPPDGDKFSVVPPFPSLPEHQKTGRRPDGPADRRTKHHFLWGVPRKSFHSSASQTRIPERPHYCANPSTQDQHKHNGQDQDSLSGPRTLRRSMNLEPVPGVFWRSPACHGNPCREGIWGTAPRRDAPLTRYPTPPGLECKDVGKTLASRTRRRLQIRACAWP